MIIKKSNESPLEKSILNSITRLFKNYKLSFLLLIFVFYSIIIFLFGGLLYKSGFFGQVIVPAVETNVRIPFNYLKGMFTTVEHIELDVKHKNFMRLYYKRQQALQEGVLHSSKKDMVPARIRWRDKNIKIRMRLKGDLGDHWADDTKWSFRVKMSRDQTVMGMSKFSLQHPRTRGFLNDWFLHRFLDYLGGFMVMRYDFVDVSLNGKELGIYLLEEHFDDKLVSNNGFENSPIIRIYDHLLWYNIDPVIGFQKDHLNENYTFSPIDAFNTGYVKRNQLLLDRFKIGKNLLEAFRRKKLKTHDVFNVRQLAKLFAIIDLFGYHHSTAFSNIRFYYNPTTSKLDPIGYDNTFIYQATSLQGQSKSFKDLYGDRRAYIDYNRIQIWYNTFFEDEIFFREYVKELDRISQKEFLDNFLTKIEPEYQAQLHKIYKTFPGYQFKGIPVFYGNQRYIRNMIHPKGAIQAYTYRIVNNKKEVILKVANVQDMLLKIHRIRYKGKDVKILNEDVLLNPKESFKYLSFENLSIKLPDSVNMKKFIPDSLQVFYSVYGLNDSLSVNVFPWNYLDEDFLKTDPIRHHDDFKSFSFILENKNEKVLIIKPGQWNVDKPLIIPEGFTVVAQAGTVLNLNKNGNIISYSPLEFIGTEKNPIVLNGRADEGNGLLLLNTEGKSIFEHVIFNQMSPIKHQNWELRATVEVYGSEAIFNYCELIETDGPSAIRFNRSSGEIKNSVIKKSSKDAIDIFSSTVHLENIRVDSVGGNGINFTMSHGKILKYMAQKLNGNGLRISDRSRVDAAKIILRNCPTGIFLTNSSKFTGTNIRLSELETGFDCRKTKSEFEGATLYVRELEKENVQNVFKKDKHSIIY